jgi:hypothetical protein
MGATPKVRKQFILDPRKIETAKKITGAKTDTEAIRNALDILIANSEIGKMLHSVKGKGNIRDVYHKISD